MFSARIDGGAELAANLGKLNDAVSKRVQVNALKEGAEPMRERMGDLAPRGNPARPNLHEEMVVNAVRSEREQEVAVAVGPSAVAFYGAFQELADEYGGVHHAPQPFARPAFDETAERSLDIILDELWWSMRRGLPGPETFVR